MNDLSLGRTRREAPLQRFHGSDAVAKLADDGSDEGVNVVVRLDLDEFGHFDGAWFANRHEVRSDQVDNLPSIQKREKRPNPRNISQIEVSFDPNVPSVCVCVRVCVD